MSSYSKWSRYYYPPNHPDIALIHKVEKPRKVTEFRPISMCNVIYRTIAKTIVNQLKTILHDVIDLSQSAFIPNRLITDNIIVGYECLHKIRYSKGKKKWQVALKLDISEAYYRVKWDFLNQIIIRLGFEDKWVKLIMNWITTSSFSVIINRTPKDMITPQRGLR